ncbi:MAG TPA: DUF2975 domain-containing protein [Cytophagales bacterium]|nr:DUF2975 domain-containing protein [Cytophagales bacterium]
MKTIGKRSIASILKFIINFAWYFQWAILAFVTVILIVVFINKDYVDHDVMVKISKPITSFTVTAKNPDYAEPTLIVESAKLNFKNKVDAVLIMESFLFLSLIFFFSLTITYLVKKIFNTLTENTPFVPENAKRLKQIGFLIILYAPLKIAYDLVSHSKATMNFLIDNAPIGTEFNFHFETIIAGLVILVIAEIFRIGTHLKEEQDLTV